MYRALINASLNFQTRARLGLGRVQAGPVTDIDRHRRCFAWYWYVTFPNSFLVRRRTAVNSHRSRGSVLSTSGRHTPLHSVQVPAAPIVRAPRHHRTEHPPHFKTRKNYRPRGALSFDHVRPGSRGRIDLYRGYDYRFPSSRKDSLVLSVWCWLVNFARGAFSNFVLKNCGFPSKSDCRSIRYGTQLGFLGKLVYIVALFKMEVVFSSSGGQLAHWGV